MKRVTDSIAQCTCTATVQGCPATVSSTIESEGGTAKWKDESETY